MIAFPYSLKIKMVKTRFYSKQCLKKKKKSTCLLLKENQISIIPLLKKITTFLMGGSQDSNQDTYFENKQY